jgi:hypothetical protein
MITTLASKLGFAPKSEVVDKLQFARSVGKRLDEHREVVEAIATSTSLFVDSPWHISHMAVQDDYLMRLYHMVHGCWPDDSTRRQPTREVCVPAHRSSANAACPSSARGNGKQMKDGRIYVLSNESMPGLVKIGWTSRSVEDRVRELATTGVPTGFKIEYEAYVREPAKVEQNIHQVLTSRGVRTNSKREFFAIAVPEVISLLQSMGIGCNKSEPDFARYGMLAESAATIEVPYRGDEVSEQKVHSTAARLLDIGRQGYPPALLGAAELYEVSYPSATLFRTYWQEYLAMVRLKAKRHPLASSNGHRERNDVGSAVADYLLCLYQRGWLLEVDFEYAGEFLIQGDQFEYDGYRLQIERPGYPSSLYERADAV